MVFKGFLMVFQSNWPGIHWKFDQLAVVFIVIQYEFDWKFCWTRAFLIKGFFNIILIKLIMLALWFLFSKCLKNWYFKNNSHLCLVIKVSHENHACKLARILWIKLKMHRLSMLRFGALIKVFYWFYVVIYVWENTALCYFK